MNGAMSGAYETAHEHVGPSVEARRGSASVTSRNAVPTQSSELLGGGVNGAINAPFPHIGQIRAVVPLHLRGAKPTGLTLFFRLESNATASK